MRRGCVLLSGAAVAAALAVPALGAPAATVRPVVVQDASGDAVSGGLDLVRVRLDRSGDGRVRAILRLRDEFVAGDLLAADGPPGSLCVRLWTVAKPGAAPPDYLVCVSATADRTLRASVAQEQPGADPRRVANATVSRPGTHSVSVRFSQTAIGRPQTIRFAAEATKPGCARTRCVDTAPDAPRTATLRLRQASA